MVERHNMKQYPRGTVHSKNDLRSQNRTNCTIDPSVLKVLAKSQMLEILLILNNQPIYLMDLYLLTNRNTGPKLKLLQDMNLIRYEKDGTKTVVHLTATGLVISRNVREMYDVLE